MMSPKLLLAFMVFFVVSLVGAIPKPHVGMVDTADLRDVGVIYTKANYEGEPKFIYHIKAKPECMALDQDVLSIKICKTDASCTFYTGSDCTNSSKNYAVRVGCGDVADVHSPKGHHFKHYRCGPADKPGPADFTLKTTPHDASADFGAGMSR